MNFSRFTQVRIPGPVLATYAMLLGAIVISGARATVVFNGAAGAPATAPEKWPAKSSLSRSKNQFELVIFAHPDCPCTRATLTELEQIMVRTNGAISANVLFSKPELDAASIASEYWSIARRIPGVKATPDQDQKETELFGARVSGETLVYDPSGRLVFSGGITAGRGHEGENAGVDAIVGIVTNKIQAPSHAPVFGCSLQNPTDEELKRNSEWRK